MWYWYTLAWFIGFVMGGLVMQWLYINALKDNLKNIRNVCPHGDYWDDCPDCRH